MKIGIVLLSIIFLVIAFACNRPSEGSKIAGNNIKYVVSAVVETLPVPQKKNEDSADDPAIWINFENTEKSFVLGTDKKGGLATYDLHGNELHYYSSGNMNNCDLRYNYPINADSVDILAASNRTSNSISLFRIYSDGKLDTIHSRSIKSFMTDDVYGLAMYHSKITNKYFVFLNSKAGEVEQWELFNNQSKIDAKLVRSFSLKTQTEGMVVDDEEAMLYIGEEIGGIWKFDAEPDNIPEGTFIKNSSEENPNIKYDIEGLAIYNSGNGNGYLLASSQGNYSYAVFERQGDNKYLGSFKIAEGVVDGAEETDGIDLTNVSLPGFPKGFLVVQDGYNYDDGKKKSQNFKIVSWEDVEKIIGQFPQ